MQKLVTTGEILKFYRNKNIANRCYGVWLSKEPLKLSPLELIFAHLTQRRCYLLILIFFKMQKSEKNTQSPVQTKNEQKRLITQNQLIRLENEKKILKLVKDYLDYTDECEPIDCIATLHQTFIESEDAADFTPEYLSEINFHVKEFYLLFSRLQTCTNNITHASKMLNVLIANPA